MKTPDSPAAPSSASTNGAPASLRNQARPRRRQRTRATLRVLLDLSALSCALWAAYALRFGPELQGERLRQVLATWPLVVLTQYACFMRLKVPRFSWSMIGVHEIVPILRGILTAAFLLLVVRHVAVRLADGLPAARLAVIPASVVVMNACLALLGIIGMRTLRRLQVERRRRRRRGRQPRTRTLLIGAGRAGRMVAEDIEFHPELGIAPVGFLDDEPALHGQMVNGLPVLGPVGDLTRAASETRATMALITIASDAGAVTHRVLEQCEAAGIQAKIIPRVNEILSGRVRVSQIRDVAIEDLLGRESVVIEDSAAPLAVRGKTVLVTGAGGSIGSELCRQILELGPATLVLVERAENALYEIHRELGAQPGRTKVVPAVADICDTRRMDTLFAHHRPHTVFHAAAHKHVPMMEWNPGEAVKNNVFGTRNVARLAQRYRSERFVLISTDKAVNPTSVMGATKRLAELLVQSLDGPCRFVSVRFGNVLSSAGSVIPLFREQIARGGPVTVTHPEMERFFMTIPEASRLVLEAAGICEGGEVMVLDMGEPILIVKLAEQMIRLSGFEPHSEIAISFTGMRPGEKLHEELTLSDESLERTRTQKILTWRGRPSARPIGRVLEALATLPSGPDDVRALLASVLPEYRAPVAPGAPGLPSVSVRSAHVRSPGPETAAAAVPASRAASLEEPGA